MLKTDLHYFFRYIDECEMCGASSSHFRVMGQRLNRSQGLRPNTKTGISTSVVKCKNCNLIFSNPQAIPADIQDHYGVSPDQYWKDNYFIPDDDVFAGEIRRFKDLIPFRPGMKALDIGAGIGKC